MERESPLIRRMTLEDVLMLSHLSEQIAEFDRGGQAEELRASLKSGPARGYWVEDGDQAVAVVGPCGGKPRISDGGGSGHPLGIPSTGGGLGTQLDDPLV